MISDSGRNALKRELEKLEKTISLKVFTSEIHCPACADTVTLCKTLAELSNGKITYEEISLDTQKDIIIEGTGIRYTGIPAGGEFTTFVQTIIMASTGKTELGHLKSKLMEISKPVVVQTVITST